MAPLERALFTAYSKAKKINVQILNRGTNPGAVQDLFSARERTGCAHCSWTPRWHCSGCNLQRLTASRVNSGGHFGASPESIDQCLAEWCSFYHNTTTPQPTSKNGVAEKKEAFGRKYESYSKVLYVNVYVPKNLVHLVDYLG